MFWMLFVCGVSLSAGQLTAPPGNFDPLWPRDAIIKRYIDGVVLEGFTMKYEEKRYVNMFFGVPYAKPPIENRRFAKPEKFEYDPRANPKRDCTYFRSACPQVPDFIRKDIPKFANISEDCLHINIYSPNRTEYEIIGINRKYPVIVYFHDGGFVNGTAQQIPGYAMAQREVVFVTVNYRLGALGFLTTEDSFAPGNFGMYDQLAALEFIRAHISKFGGNEKNITVMGYEAGAASVGLHLISPKTRSWGDLNLFQRAIIMSGSDMCDWAVIDSYWRPRYYAQQLAQLVGCSTKYPRVMVECLRFDVKWQDILEASMKVKRRAGATAGPWAPVMDGENGFLPEMPRDIRFPRDGRNASIQPVQLLGGVVMDEGSQAIADLDLPMDLDLGITKQMHEKVVKDYVASRHVKNKDSMEQYLDFLYTWWPDPSNKTAMTFMIMGLYGDSLYGAGVDAVLKSHVSLNETYMYEFHFRSNLTKLPKWMGVAHRSELQYVFGYPYLNQTSLNLTGLELTEVYDEKAKNISDYMMITMTGFAAVGNPTPVWFMYNINDTYHDDKERLRNNSWFPYNLGNLTYMEVSRNNSTSYTNYRQQYYGFWNDRFRVLSYRDPDFTTYPPTPPNLLQYTTATWSLVGMAVVVLLIILVLAVVLYRRWKKEEY